MVYHWFSQIRSPSISKFPVASASKVLVPSHTGGLVVVGLVVETFDEVVVGGEVVEPVNVVVEPVKVVEGGLKVVVTFSVVEVVVGGQISIGMTRLMLPMISMGCSLACKNSVTKAVINSACESTYQQELV